MPFRIGTDTFEAYKITYGGSDKIRAIYVGDIHIWPEYDIATVPSSFSHIGNANALGSFNFSNSNTNPTTLGGTVSGNVNTATFVSSAFTPDLDPAGGSITFKLLVNETSSWHYLAFKLLVPPDVTSISASGENSGAMTVSKVDTASHTAFSNETYTGDIYEIKCDTTEINPSDSASGYDKPITITINISQNHTSHPKYRDIVLYDVADEFNNYGNITTNKIITGYRQKINFSISAGSISGASYAHNQCGVTQTLISNLNSWVSGLNLDLIQSSYWDVSCGWSASTSGNSLTITPPSASTSVCTNGSSTSLTLTYYYRLNSSDSYSSVSASANFSIAASNNWLATAAFSSASGSSGIH